jgi:cytochrome c553
MTINQPDVAVVPSGASSSVPLPTGVARLALLLGMLVLVMAALIYDYAWARYGVEAADQRIGALIEARTRLGAQAGDLLMAVDIHKELGMEPTWVDRHAEDQYEIEYYCWWGRVPFFNMRRHYLAIVYVGDAPRRRFSSHHKNERPPRSALPMPFVEKRASSVATDADLADLPLKDRPHLRRPIASAWIEPERLLAIANQRSGSISVVDVPKRKVLDEVAVGERLADLAADPMGRWMLTIDEQKHELIVLQRQHDSLSVAARHRVSPYPVSVAVSPSGERISVASLWSRKLTIFDCSGDTNAPGEIEQLAEIPLPFNPREHQFSNDEAVFVNDAFTNRYYEVNIRGRTRTPRGEKMFSGSDPSRRLVKGVGLRAEIRNGRESVVGESVAITLGATSDPTPEERGEELFYSRKLSAGKNCHDCHNYGHTNYQLADTLGDGTSGTPKRIPTLLGTRLTYPWAWNGTISELDDQVRKSLETTMHVRNVTQRQVVDITAFLHTLDPPPPLQPATADPSDQAQLSRGQALFKDFGCTKCHVPQLTYTSPDVYDVGLTDEKGMSKFNPPSLLGVGQGYSFFHDGRAKTLEEVFTVHGHQLNRELADDELADLLRFLRSL